jgi:hypothetical protein
LWQVTKVCVQTQISGRIINKATNQPVPYVSVALYRKPDSVAMGGFISDSLGRFLITSVTAGVYKLNTFFIGYKTVLVPLVIGPGQSADLGTLLLESDPRLLKEVQARGQRADVTV